MLVDGKLVEPLSRRGDTYYFEISHPPASVRIVSRDGVPTELGFARDARSLGVAIRRIALHTGARNRSIEADDARLQDGFHPFEPDNGIRWTDGDAALPAELFEGVDGAHRIDVTLGGAMRYLAEIDIRKIA